jgi:hypothetical protein
MGGAGCKMPGLARGIVQLRRIPLPFPTTLA